MPTPKRPAVLPLIKKLIHDALQWSHDEIEMARTDAKAMVRDYTIALALIFISFAILIAGVFTLAQTVIGAIAVYVHGHIVAGLIVGLALIFITIFLLLVARYYFTRKSKPDSLIFKRITGSNKD